MSRIRARYGPAVVLGSIVLLAFAVRLAWTLWTAPLPPRLSDPEYYNATALSLARHLRYAVLFDNKRNLFLPNGSATAFWPPGYSAFLAAWYWLFGENLTVARLANVVAGTLTVVPTYLVGRRLFGNAAGLVGAAMAAVLPSLVFWTPVLMSETFFTFVFACALALLLHGNRENGTLRAGIVAAFGLAVGIATLVRGQALVLLPMAAIWWTMNGMPWRHVGIGVVGVTVVTAAMLIPWSIRNVVVMDSPILMSANVGYNLRIGHAPYATGRYLVPQDLWNAQPGITFQEREVLFNDLGSRRGARYAVGHPTRELALTGRKIMWLWRPDSDSLLWVSTFGATALPSAAHEPLRWLLDASYLVVLGLAAAAALVPTLRRGFVFVALLAVFWTAIHVVFFGEPRYHLPLLVVIVPLAGATVVTIADLVIDMIGRARTIRAHGHAPLRGRV